MQSLVVSTSSTEIILQSQFIIRVLKSLHFLSQHKVSLVSTPSKRFYSQLQKNIGIYKSNNTTNYFNSTRNNIEIKRNFSSNSAKFASTFEQPVGSSLIPVINKLQEIGGLVGSQLVDLPQIVVIGAQSSGKSSVLENLVGRDFLPRGSGLVTRRPLILQLHRNTDSKEEWGEFSHKPKQKMNFEEIKKEIIAETERSLGKNSKISKNPILLKIYRPNVLPLTLVDTPGITRIPVGDQPADIETQIRNMVIEYIRQPNAIILAVQPATADLATSDALKLAKEVDPLGDRTIGVLTKLDIMDKGTNAMDALIGRTIPLKLGFVGMINRSQQDINVGKSIKSMLDDEVKFFKDHNIYKNVTDRVGTQILSSKCHKLLEEHIRQVLPNLESQVKKKLRENELNFYGPLIFDLDDDASRGNQLRNLLIKFSEHYSEVLDGRREVSTTQLNGGARIRYIIHDHFVKDLNKIDPLQGLSPQGIKTAILSASGINPSLFVPYQAFELLVKRQLELLRDPALRCAERVLEELLRIVHDLDVKELSRFKGLRQRVDDVSGKTLRHLLKPTNEMLENFMKWELNYINTSHPDFVGITGGADIQTKGRKYFVHFNGIEQIIEEPKIVAQEDKESSGFFGRLFGSSQPEPKKKENPTTERFAPIKVDQSLSASDKEQIKLIQRAISSYFMIVRKKLQDTVPKIIVYHLVNSSRDSLQKNLMDELYKEPLFGVLLQEDPVFKAKREQLMEQKETLKRAKHILREASATEGLVVHDSL